MIGIFGGTFDPVHYGHLKPAQDILQQLGLRKILFIPNREPPHRQQPELNTVQRVELLRLALADYPGFEIDLCEIERQGKSYMVDTLTSLSERYRDESLCLIIGMDAFLTISDWHRWQSLFDYCHIVVTARPGFALPDELPEAISQRIVTDAAGLRANSAGKILIKSVSLLDVSSSEIRRAFALGRNLAEYMPEAVSKKYTENLSGERQS